MSPLMAQDYWCCVAVQNSSLATEYFLIHKGDITVIHHFWFTEHCAVQEMNSYWLTKKEYEYGYTNLTCICAWKQHHFLWIGDQKAYYIWQNELESVFPVHLKCLKGSVSAEDIFSVAGPHFVLTLVIAGKCTCPCGTAGHHMEASFR